MSKDDQYYEIRRMSDYLRALDPVNAMIIEALEKHDPRNMSLIAKSIGLPQTTVSFRLRKLVKEHGLEIFAHLNWNKLGLIRAVVIADASPGGSKTLWRVLENHDYLTYLVKCYGKFRGCYATFTIPAEHKEWLKDYLDKAVQLQILPNYLLFWTTNFCRVHRNFDWFDFKKKRWIFKWQQWVQEILNASENLSASLMDPKAYPVMVDKKDLIMLRELEQNGIITFNKLAKAVGITPQGIRYRYYKHIIERGLIIGHGGGAMLYPYELSDMSSFIIEFEDEKTLAKFTNCLDKKPFILSYTKIIGQTSIIAHTYAPKLEFPNLIESLDRLAELNLIKNFFHVTLDITQCKDNPLHYELFEDGTWHYNLKENLEKLRKITGSN